MKKGKCYFSVMFTYSTHCLLMKYYKGQSSEQYNDEGIVIKSNSIDININFISLLLIYSTLIRENMAKC